MIPAGWLSGYRMQVTDIFGTVVYEERFDHHLRKYGDAEALRRVLSIISPDLTALGVTQ